MRTMTRLTTRVRQRGQALAEMGMVILLFTVLTLGIIDFGRMLMILNVITHAARDGARIASFYNGGDWTNGGLTGTNLADVQTRVRAQIGTVMSSSDASGFSVTPALVASGTGAGQAVQVTVVGDIPFLFSFPGAWGGSIQVTRVATYRFEGSTAGS